MDTRRVDRLSRITAPPPAHFPQYLEYAVNCHRYGSLVMNLKSRFENNPAFHFSAVSQTEQFRLLPPHFQKALRHLHSSLRLAHSHLQIYQGMGPQAAFEKATLLPGRIREVHIKPFSIVFVMDSGDFYKLQAEVEPIRDIRETVVATTLMGSMIKDAGLKGLVCLLPGDDNGTDPMSSSHESWHIFLNKLVMPGSSPQETLAQRRERLRRDAWQTHSFRLLLEEKKLVALDELRCLAATGEIFTCFSQSGVEDMLKPYKPVPWELFPANLTHAQQRQQIQAVYDFYHIIPPIWRFIDTYGVSPSLHRILAAIDYPEIIPMLNFLTANRESFAKAAGSVLL